ncbi:MAG: hypothetical protein Q8O67_23860 [Deltaproteobacteria bacterium]|nr:hypothetical protein [Deltaproteobacteria bacterium]
MRLAVVVLLLLAVPGCAGVGEALIGSCLAATLQVGVEIACQACSNAVCDDDDSSDTRDADDDDDDERAEIGPDLEPPMELASATCRLQLDDGQALRLGCVDGTSALSLGEESEAPRQYGENAHTRAGDVVVSSAADVAALAGVMAITGSLRVESPRLLRVRLPALRSVGGDVVVSKNPRLLRLELSALVDVGGALVVRENAALSGDPVPVLYRAARVDVIDNEALPTSVVDRLLALPP